MLGLFSKNKYLIMKREYQELEQTTIYWKKMHDIEFMKRLDTIKELAKRDRRIEQLEKELEEK